MKILVIDDEPLALSATSAAVKKAIPDADITSFSWPEQALESAEKTKYDVAFSDIQMPGMNGIALARGLKKTNPLINIIFVTGFSDYQGEAIHVHASGYINKPVTADDVRAEMENLLHPIEPKKAHIYAKTFGNFTLLVDNQPLICSRSRAVEMLAYLIDRHGSMVNRKEMAAVIFDKDEFTRADQVYLSTIAHDLKQTLDEAGIGYIFQKTHSGYRIDPTEIQCDSWDYLRGDTSVINHFTGEYMEQYSWAEYLKDKFFSYK